MRSGRLPFDAKMFPPMEKARTLRGVRVAMLAIACVTAAAGFGLHPEPASADLQSGLALYGGTVAESGAAAHDCLACRAHRPLLPSPTPAEIAGARVSTTLHVAARPPVIRVFPILRPDGRAPPATS
jgi:hypothetical protein